MSLKRKNRQRDEFDEKFSENIEREKNKRLTKKSVGRQASYYSRVNEDIPQRDDDYSFMVHNVMR